MHFGVFSYRQGTGWEYIYIYIYFFFFFGGGVLKYKNIWGIPIISDIFFFFGGGGG